MTKLSESTGGNNAKIKKICENCVQRIGEECGIDGHEVYSDTTCDEFCAE